MAEPHHAEVYPGCTVEITDRAAFARNPLYQNPLVGFKDDNGSAVLDAHHNVPGGMDEALADCCVRCNRYGFGSLCDDHRAELAEVTS